MRVLPAIFANVFLIVAAFGAGTPLIRFLPASLHRVDRLAAVLLGGLGSLGTLIFLVGLVHFSLATILVIFVPAALFGIWSFLKGNNAEFPPYRMANRPVIPTLVILVVMGVTFLGGLAEPVGDFVMSDSIAYHYLGPRVWLRDGAIRPVPDESLTSFPAVVETLYASLLALGGPRAMALFAFTSFGLLLLVTYGFALRLKLDSRGAWWAAALVATMPAVYRGSFDGYIDAILCCFVLLSLRFAIDAEGPGNCLLSGLFSGLAMGTKYLGVIYLFVILGCASLIHLWHHREKLSIILSRLVLLGAVATAVASPWYLRNWIVLGFPIYPPTRTLSHYFPVKYMSPQAVAILGAVVDRSGRGMGHTFWGFLLLPFRLTFHPANYLNGAGGVGLTLLMLAPFGILICWRDLFVKVTVVFMFFFTVAWFVTEQDGRFLMEVFVILAAFAVWGWRFVAQKAPRFGPLLAGVSVACSILYGLIMIVPRRAPDVRAALSVSYEQGRRCREIPFLESFNRLNQDPAVRKVLVLEPLVPTYYLEKDYLKPVGRFGEETLPQGSDLGGVLNNLSELGITHILDVQYKGNGFRLPAQRSGLILVQEREDQRIYRVSPSP
jgi:hypothetical protein